MYGIHYILHLFTFFFIFFICEIVTVRHTSLRPSLFVANALHIPVSLKSNLSAYHFLLPANRFKNCIHEDFTKIFVLETFFPLDILNEETLFPGHFY